MQVISAAQLAFLLKLTKGTAFFGLTSRPWQSSAPFRAATVDLSHQSQRDRLMIAGIRAQAETFFTARVGDAWAYFLNYRLKA